MKPATNAMTLGQRSARGAGVTMAGQAIKFVVQLGSVVILARLLSPQDYGLMAMALVVVSAAEVVRDFGLSSAAVQAKELTIAQRDNLFWINLTVGMMLSIVVLSAADLVGQAYGHAELTTMTRALAVVFLLNGGATQYRAGLSRALRFKAVATSDTVSVISGLLAAVALAFAGAGFWALVAQQLVQSIVTLALLLWFGRWLPGRPTRHAQMRTLIVFGANQMGAQMINYLSRNIDNVVVGIRFGVTELGFYSRAYNLVRLPMNQISTPVSEVAMPVLARLQDDPVRFRAYVLRGQTVMMHTMACLFGFFAAQADPIVELVLGAKWSPIVPFLIVLAIGGVFQTASSSSQWVMMARGQGGAFLRMTLVTRAGMIVLIIVGSVWGTIGVACAYTGSCILIWLVSTWWSGRVADAPVGALLRNVRVATTGYTCCALVSYYAGSLAIPGGFLLQIVVGALAMVIALALVCLCWPVFRRDLRSAVAVIALMLPGRPSDPPKVKHHLNSKDR